MNSLAVLFLLGIMIVLLYCLGDYSWLCRQRVMEQECTDTDFNHSDFGTVSILTEYLED